MKKKSPLQEIDSHVAHKFKNPICTVIAASVA